MNIFLRAAKKGSRLVTAIQSLPRSRPSSFGNNPAEVKLSVPLEFRRGSLRDDEKASVESGLKLVELISSYSDVTGKTILDFGCGVKLAQALYQLDSPQHTYCGLDVYTKMISHLKNRFVRNDKYHFESVNFRNEMYAKMGEEMTNDTSLPIPARLYDIVTMFSVITHMTPKDAEATLCTLRRYVASDGVLIFSAFIDEQQEEEFVDKITDRPLLQASFRRDFLENILSRAGWKIESLNEPINAVIQHHYFCTPA